MGPFKYVDCQVGDMDFEIEIDHVLPACLTYGERWTSLDLLWSGIIQPSST